MIDQEETAYSTDRSIHATKYMSKTIKIKRTCDSNDNIRTECRYCDSCNLIYRGGIHWSETRFERRFKCKDCGGYMEDMEINSPSEGCE